SQQLVSYAGASGDFNLGLTGDETASQVGLEVVIVQRLLSMPFLGQYLCWLTGPESVRRFEVRFVGIVRPGDVLTCRGRVKPVASKSADHEVLIQMWAENQRGEQVTVGDAEVIIR